MSPFFSADGSLERAEQALAEYDLREVQRREADVVARDKAIHNPGMEELIEENAGPTHYPLNTCPIPAHDSLSCHSRLLQF